MSAHTLTLPLFVLATVLGFTWIGLSLGEPYPLSFVLKAAPLTLLAVIAWLNTSGRIRIILVIAFLGSATGDALLGIDRQTLLKPALFAFLVTQVLYAWLFWERRAELNAMRVVGMLVAVLVLAVMLWLTLPAAPAGLTIPLIVYSVTLVIMACGGVMSEIGRMVPYGALLFLTSDSLIAVNQFVSPFDYSTQIIVTIYTTAQLLIGWSLVVKEPVLAR